MVGDSICHCDGRKVRTRYQWVAHLPITRVRASSNRPGFSPDRGIVYTQGVVHPLADLMRQYGNIPDSRVVPEICCVILRIGPGLHGRSLRTVPANPAKS